MPASQQEHSCNCFDFAVTALHKCAHAAHNAVIGERQEGFFEDAIVPEAGFEINARLFGGTFEREAGFMKLAQ